MDNSVITVNSVINEKIFRDFAVFDIFYMRKRWVSPMIFFALMLAFAIVCFARSGSEPQAVLVGGVLLVVGLGLPAVFFTSFFRSVNLQAKGLKARGRRVGYTIELSGEPDGIAASIAETSERHEWSKVFRVYHKNDCTYLYVSAVKAFLLPDENVENMDKLRELLRLMLPREKLYFNG